MTYHGGPVITTDTNYLIQFNSPTGDFSIWGDPWTFLFNLFGTYTDIIHTVDQYVGQTANNRYTVNGTTAWVSWYNPPRPMSFSDVQASVIAAVHAIFPSGGGGGYNIEYHIFLPPGQDTCLSSTVCYSPDNSSTFSFCAYHSSMNTTDTNGAAIHVIYSVEPYQNVPGCQVTGGPNGTLVEFDQ